MNKFGLSTLTILLSLHHAVGWTDKYVALGDSYAAGDGAGRSRWFPHLDAACGRFSNAYPVQVSQNSSLVIEHFQNVACGGTTTSTIIYKQMNYLKGADLVTIQVGGNEVDFFPILNECIQQWKPLSTCDRELERARGLIQSTQFVQSFDNMVRHAATKVNMWSQILVLGYARFFNATTSQCNNATFSKTNPANILSNELRESFNELVVLLNQVIESSARAHGAVYVDTDSVFEGHRFCEEGVEEPRPDWEGTWFFRDSPNSVAGESSFQDDFARGFFHQRVLNPFNGFTDLTRTFHPTTRGHEAIARHLSDVIMSLDEETQSSSRA